MKSMNERKSKTAPLLAICVDLQLKQKFGKQYIFTMNCILGLSESKRKIIRAITTLC